MPSTWSSVFCFIKDGYNGSQVVKLSLSFILGCIISNSLYLNALTDKICLFFSLFSALTILKCLSLFPSLGFPQLWLEAILKGMQALDCTATCTDPILSILLGHTHGRQHAKLPYVWTRTFPFVGGIGRKMLYQDPKTIAISSPGKITHYLS